MAKVTPTLIVHGGARGKYPTPEMEYLFTKTVHEILEEAFEILEKGGSAVDASVRAVELLEDHPIFNAGRGSKIQADGKIRMSASLMDGKALKFSSVFNVQSVRNPIALAKILNSAPYRNLAGAGAVAKAREWKLHFRSAFTKGRKEEHESAKKGKTGTVGAVALDSKGRIAAATSTGGRGMEWPDRVSDSPTVAGNYANELVGLSATGVGEEIIDFALCAKVATRVEDGLTVEKAMRKSFKEAAKRKFEFGAIALDKQGRYSAISTSDCMLWGVKSSKETRVTFDAD